MMWKGLLLIALVAVFVGEPATAGQIVETSATAEQANDNKTTAGNESATKQTRHSGRVVTVDPEARTLTFEEMGPWTPDRSAAVKRTITLAPGADIDLVSRADEKGPKGWVGGFVESPTSLAGLMPGDWVTVVVERDREPRAISVDAVRPTTSREAPGRWTGSRRI